MESTKRAIKFQLNESKVSIAKFWAVILIVDIFVVLISQIADLNIGINGFGDGINVISLMGVNILAIIVYLAVYNYELYYKDFPIALSFSITRRDYFKSMILKNILVAFIFAVIQSILMKIDPILVKFIGKDPMYDFKAFNIQTDSIISIMIYFFISFLLFSAIWNLIAGLNYKFGPKFWIVLGGLSILTGIFVNVNLFALIFPGQWLNVRMDASQFIISLSITISIYIAIYFVTINTNIKNKA